MPPSLASMMSTLSGVHDALCVTKAILLINGKCNCHMDAIFIQIVSNMFPEIPFVYSISMDMPLMIKRIVITYPRGDSVLRGIPTVVHTYITNGTV